MDAGLADCFGGSGLGGFGGARPSAFAWAACSRRRRSASDVIPMPRSYRRTPGRGSDRWQYGWRESMATANACIDKVLRERASAFKADEDATVH